MMRIETRGAEPNWERRRTITKLVAEGLTKQEIADKLGMTKTGVAYYCQLLGLKAKREVVLNRGWITRRNQERRDQIIELRKQGLSLNAIAQKLGVTYGLIGYYNRAMGLPSVKTAWHKRTEERIAKLKSLEHLHNSEVADIMGMSPVTVSYYRRKYKLKKAPTNLRGPLRDPDRIKLAIELRRKGLSMDKIGELMGGISRQAVENYLKYDMGRQADRLDWAIKELKALADKLPSFGGGQLLDELTRIITTMEADVWNGRIIRNYEIH